MRRTGARKARTCRDRLPGSRWRWPARCYPFRSGKTEILVTLTNIWTRLKVVTNRKCIGTWQCTMMTLSGATSNHRSITSVIWRRDFIGGETSGDHPQFIIWRKTVSSFLQISRYDSTGNENIMMTLIEVYCGRTVTCWSRDTSTYSSSEGLLGVLVGRQVEEISVHSVPTHNHLLDRFQHTGI